MKKTILLLLACSFAAFTNAQHNTEIEIKNESIEIKAGGDVNINTSDGKAYYNGKEISTLTDSIIETPWHTLKIKYLDLRTVERIDGVENGIPYSDFLIIKSQSVTDGTQWCARLEYSIGMHKNNQWPGWDGKVLLNNRYYVYQAYEFGNHSIVILDTENEKLYLRLYGAGEGSTFTSFRVEFSYYNFHE